MLEKALTAYEEGLRSKSSRLEVFWSLRRDISRICERILACFFFIENSIILAPILRLSSKLIYDPWFPLIFFRNLLSAMTLLPV